MIILHPLYNITLHNIAIMQLLRHDYFLDSTTLCTKIVTVQYMQIHTKVDANPGHTFA